MSKIKSLYVNNVDKVWYDSSNILYSECDDIIDSLKTLRVFFKNGRKYQYYDVNVNDYILFRENDSQGKALTKFIKQYKCERLEDFDVESVKEELKTLIDEENKPNKNELFDDLYNTSKKVEGIANKFKTLELSDDELSYISFVISNLSKVLLLTNFTDRDVNFVNVNDKLETLIKSFNNDSKNKNTEELNNFLKNKLL